MSDMTVDELIDELAEKAIPSYIPYYKQPFIAGKTPLLYSGPYFDSDELKMAMRALLKGGWISNGTQTSLFQTAFAKKFNVKHAHFMNSGSSANLVLITALKKHLKWQDGDEIIVSPVGFPTTIAPIVQNNLKPVFIDIEMNTLNFDVSKIREKINYRTRAIFVSPVLGNPPDMDELKQICYHYNVILIGDNCDSLGSKWDGQYLTDNYYAWTTSFYVAHHLSTMEGGMVCSNDEEFIATARSISWWGRDCRCIGKANLTACGTCGNRFSKWLANEGVDVVIDHKYVFTNMGYNLKPLDLQAAIGLAQLRKIDEIEQRRRENAWDIATVVNGFLGAKGFRVANRLDKADPCWFGVPIICPSNEARQKLVDHLEKNKIQTRSYFAGNLLCHPGYRHLDDALQYPNANRALSDVFFLGCPPHYISEHIDYIGQMLEEFANV